MRKLVLALFVSVIGCGDNTDVTEYSVALTGAVECTGRMSLVFDEKTGDFEKQGLAGAWSCGEMSGAVTGAVVTPFTGHTEMDADTGIETARVIVTKNNTQLNGVVDFTAGRSTFKALLR